MSKFETEGDDEKPPYIVRLEFDEYAREATESHVPPSVVARQTARAVNAMPAATTGSGQRPRAIQFREEGGT
jgi:hypothetical protein